LPRPTLLAGLKWDDWDAGQKVKKKHDSKIFFSNKVNLEITILFGLQQLYEWPCYSNPNPTIHSCCDHNEKAQS